MGVGDVALQMLHEKSFMSQKREKLFIIGSLVFYGAKRNQGLRKHSRLMLNIYKKYAWLPQQNMLLDLAGHELVLQHNDSHKTQLFARGDDHRTGPLDLSMGFGFSKSKHLCIWSTYARSNLLRELYIGYN